jgi:catenin alpha
VNRADEDLDPEDVELDENYTLETRSKSSAHTGEHGVDEYLDISGITTAREAMGKMPEEDKQKILQQVEYFRSEKLKFDREVAKWDDTGNDIIVLAKHMCMIMMEMTDFTRDRGPLKTTMDVIKAAKKISEAGTKLDKLTTQITEQCPELKKICWLTYLQRIALYCHQMNITSKVKADVQNISGELIVSGLDVSHSGSKESHERRRPDGQSVLRGVNEISATGNYEYIFSNRGLEDESSGEKTAGEARKVGRSSSQSAQRVAKKVQNPIHALSEFQSPTESV